MRKLTRMLYHMLKTVTLEVGKSSTDRTEDTDWGRCGFLAPDKWGLSSALDHWCVREPCEFFGVNVESPSPLNRENAPNERLYATAEKAEQD
jgi:hypothetical protein